MRKRAPSTHRPVIKCRQGSLIDIDPPLAPEHMSPRVCLDPLVEDARGYWKRGGFKHRRFKLRHHQNKVQLVFEPNRSISSYGFLFLILHTQIASVSALPAESVQNISVPDGATTHGDLHTPCTPASAFDVVLFYLTNYFAHAVTVKLYGGEAGLAKYLSYVAALLFPASDLVRGLAAIVRRGRFGKGPLEKAVRSGVLCMVVRMRDGNPRINSASQTFE
ncbi:hypothetical protein DFH08DRAFT_799071 [Mycena albidolilacea]|uniref:Uncharacterized protein n=1 Tax=Mycena albidolilacea TaxID=1033008 RepID=A0AAD7APX5_9AGAR|nr:hypothetical protein DFH08DRAFT_799071 [Mycena albidolilacea]